MKHLRLIFLGLAVFGVTCLHAQEQAKPAPQPAQQEPALAKFDLDFPGGTPGELVAAIQKASGRPLNAVIYPDDANIQLPPLKMKSVTTPELFTALAEASARFRFVGNTQSGESFGFSTKGKPLDNSVWYFKNYSQPVPLKESRFYLLTDYLEQGLTVDDITTAIQTAWKLRGDNPVPTLNYHKETKLLIAVGYPSQLGTIDDALKALRPKPKTEAEPKEVQGDSKKKT